MSDSLDGEVEAKSGNVKRKLSKVKNFMYSMG